MRSRWAAAHELDRDAPRELRIARGQHHAAAARARLFLDDVAADADRLRLAEQRARDLRAGHRRRDVGLRARAAEQPAEAARRRLGLRLRLARGLVVAGVHPGMLAHPRSGTNSADP